MRTLATCGVVVNGGAVLTVPMNDMPRAGASVEIAAFEAAKRRSHPILLTSLTTFFGLSPMIFETSPQARYLVPMAIALGFGIMFSAAVVLFMVPAAHLIAAGFRQNLAKLWGAAGHASPPAFDKTWPEHVKSSQGAPDLFAHARS